MDNKLSWMCCCLGMMPPLIVQGIVCALIPTQHIQFHFELFIKSDSIYCVKSLHLLGKICFTFSNYIDMIIQLSDTTSSGQGWSGSTHLAELLQNDEAKTNSSVQMNDQGACCCT